MNILPLRVRDTTSYNLLQLLILITIKKDDRSTYSMKFYHPDMIIFFCYLPGLELTCQVRSREAELIVSLMDSAGWRGGQRRGGVSITILWFSGEAK